MSTCSFVLLHINSCTCGILAVKTSVGTGILVYRHSRPHKPYCLAWPAEPLHGKGLWGHRIF